MDDEVRYNPPIIELHSRSVCVENAHDLDGQIVLSAVVKEKRLGTSLSLIITGSWSNGIHMPSIAFWLRMDLWIAVHLTGRGLKDSRPSAFGEAQQIYCSQNVGFGSLNGVTLIVHRRGGASKIVNFIYFYIERERYVVPKQLEPRVRKKMSNILPATCVKIVDAKDFFTHLYQSITEMRPEKARATCNQYSFGLFRQRF
ncbi:hypothetical protein ATDW_21930 [Asticcacaulis sp. DW145]|nr:hypothetical protein ATDW_21930 [Asticcacaulis sp. DW145]